VVVSPAIAASPNTQSSTTPGGPYTYTVPAGVSSVHVEAIGGAGGANLFGDPGGRGGDVAADLSVSSGQSLSVYVGGDGSTSAGGANGGGSPGNMNGVLLAGGGGGSDVRAAPNDLSSRLLVAAGGGGSGGFGTAGDAGQEGTNGGDCDDTPAMPGTQTAGGAGGGGCDTIPGNTASGSDGSFGAGGTVARFRTATTTAGVGELAGMAVAAAARLAAAPAALTISGAPRPTRRLVSRAQDPR
jgi:Glycine rich protein